MFLEQRYAQKAGTQAKTTSITYGAAKGSIRVWHNAQDRLEAKEDTLMAHFYLPWSET